MRLRFVLLFTCLPVAATANDATAQAPAVDPPTIAEDCPNVHTLRHAQLTSTGRVEVEIPGSPEVSLHIDATGPTWDIWLETDDAEAAAAWCEKAGSASFFNILGQLEGSALELRHGSKTSISAPHFKPAGIEWRVLGSKQATVQIWFHRARNLTTEVSQNKWREGDRLWRARVRRSL